jgi:hypothetical protein
MSVFIRTGRWPSSRIPYTVKEKAQQIEPWLQELNKCLGYELLVRKENTDQNYILVDSGAGRSETIGFKGGMQTITALEKYSMQHELLHALGFHHEQYHINFPWDDSQPARKPSTMRAAISMYEYEKLASGSWNDELFKQLKKQGVISPERIDHAKSLTLANDDLTDEKKNELAGKRYANGQLNGRFYILNDKNVESWGFCDFDSVMMYSECRNAVMGVLGGQTPPAPPTGKAAIQQSGKAGEFLSVQDVAAIQHMYPRT